MMTENEFIMQIVLEERRTLGHDMTMARLSQVIREAKQLWLKTIEQLD